jgi:hypothetical protein
MTAFHELVVHLSLGGGFQPFPARRWWIDHLQVPERSGTRPLLGKAHRLLLFLGKHNDAGTFTIY